MSLSVGIVGLPNSGKSTLFNALLQRQIAQVAEYPFTTIEPNTGVVEVPDERLGEISQATGISKIVPAAIKFIDIAGLVKGANEGEGLGNKFLGHIREVDAILHVVRAFENEKVPHVQGKIDPQDDMEIVNLELELAGIEKPTIYILNIDERQLSLGVEVARQQFSQLDGGAPRSSASWRIACGAKSLPFRSPLGGTPPRAPIKSKIGQVSDAVTVCAKLEAELAELSLSEQKQYLKELEVEETGLDKIIRESYKLLDLVTFFTVAKGLQVQAWPLKKEATLLEAASLVHTDMAKGFIKAEVVDWQDLVSAGGWQKAAEKGKIRLEGRDDHVRDGEVVEFKFKV